MAEGRLAVPAAKGAVGIEHQPALGLARVAGWWVGLVEAFEVVAGRGGEAEFVADEVVEHRARIAADGAVGFVGDDQIEVGRRNSRWYLLLKSSDRTAVTTISARRQSSRPLL